MARFDILSIVSQSKNIKLQITESVLYLFLTVLFVTFCLIIYYFRDVFERAYENNIFCC